MPTFSEPEQFLIKQWTDARRVEDAIKTVRKKYAGIFDRVVDQVTRRHTELDYWKTVFKPEWGHVAIAKTLWPRCQYGWPSGYYIDYVQLEFLTSDQETSPYSYVWVHETPLKWKEAEERLLQEAKKVFSDKQLAAMNHGIDD